MAQFESKLSRGTVRNITPQPTGQSRDILAVACSSVGAAWCELQWPELSPWQVSTTGCPGAAAEPRPGAPVKLQRDPVTCKLLVADASDRAQAKQGGQHLHAGSPPAKAPAAAAGLAGFAAAADGSILAATGAEVKVRAVPQPRAVSKAALSCPQTAPLAAAASCPAPDASSRAADSSRSRPEAEGQARRPAAEQPAAALRAAERPAVAQPAAGNAAKAAE